MIVIPGELVCKTPMRLRTRAAHGCQLAVVGFSCRPGHRRTRAGAGQGAHLLEGEAP